MWAGETPRLALPAILSPNKTAIMTSVYLILFMDRMPHLIFRVASFPPPDSSPGRCGYWWPRFLYEEVEAATCPRLYRGDGEVEFNHRPLGPRAQALPPFVIWVHQCGDSPKSCPPVTQLTSVITSCCPILYSDVIGALSILLCGAPGWFSVAERTQPSASHRLDVQSVFMELERVGSPVGLKASPSLGPSASSSGGRFSTLLNSLG